MVFDVVIVGAGAAGVAAGRRIAETHHDFLIVEASDRVGGRAWTLASDGMALDLGCGWLHSGDRNPWTKVAEHLGLEVDRTRPAWGRQFENLGFAPDEQKAAEDAYAKFEQRLRDDPPASDRASDLLDPDCPWNNYLEARSGYINGVELEQLSVRDYLAYDDSDTGVNWRLPRGYGSLVEAAAQGLPIRFNAIVETIDRTGSPLRLLSSAGTLLARSVIVTVPTEILSSGKLRFDPPLDDKAEAAANLPLGLANKLFIELDQPEELAPDCHMIGNPRLAETGSYYLRPFGRPLIEVFFGGAGARELEAQGEGATIDFAFEELTGLLGSSFRKRARPLVQSRWASAPFAGGSYSHALPGHAAARALLVEPVEDRIFFAGEACSACDFSTAHGAYETGLAAAERLLLTL